MALAAIVMYDTIKTYCAPGGGLAFRVFVSAVSKELGEARLNVARVLRRKGLEVKDQAHFAQGGGVLLDKLKDYIAGCDAVLCLVGDHTGVFPTPEHAATFGPALTFERYSTATGATTASTTQWEFLLAKTFGKPTYVFIADLVIDNVDDEGTANVVEARLAHLAHGALVVTGRLANWSRLFTPLHLDVLSPEASVAFLLERTDGERVARTEDAPRPCPISPIVIGSPNPLPQ